MTQQEADVLDMAGHPDTKAEAGADKLAGKVLFGCMVADNLSRIQVELGPNVVDTPAAPVVPAQSK